MPLTPNDLIIMRNRIVEAMQPERIILFGSQARGDDHGESDVDLLVITTRPFDLQNSRRMAMTQLWRLLADIPVAKDIALFSHDEVEQWRSSKNHLIARALAEGVVLYEQP